VVGAIRHCADQLKHYDVQAFVVMANHVHLLVLPRVSPSRFLQALKGATPRARRIDYWGARASRSGRLSRTIIGCEMSRSRTASRSTSKTTR
jgi:REP element-mobilizing transposase RayT